MGVETEVAGLGLQEQHLVAHGEPEIKSVPFLRFQLPRRKGNPQPVLGHAVQGGAGLVRAGKDDRRLGAAKQFVDPDLAEQGFGLGTVGVDGHAPILDLGVGVFRYIEDPAVHIGVKVRGIFLEGEQRLLEIIDVSARQHHVPNQLFAGRSPRASLARQGVQHGCRRNPIAQRTIGQLFGVAPGEVDQIAGRVKVLKSRGRFSVPKRGMAGGDDVLVGMRQAYQVSQNPSEPRMFWNPPRCGTRSRMSVSNSG